MFRSLYDFLFGSPNVDAFTTKEPRPKVAYKYTSAHWLESIVRDGMFAFPGVDQLNDPHESAFDANFESLLSEATIPRSTGDARERELIQVRFGHVNDWFENPYAEKNLQARLERERDALKTKNDQIRQTNRMREKARSVLIHARQNIGVLSLTRHRCDVLMWAHYGQNSSGVCVGVDLSHPSIASYVSKVPAWEKMDDIFRPQSIVYRHTVPRYAVADTAQVIKAAFFSKSEAWKYEEEVRVLRPTVGCDAVSKDGVAIFRLPLSAISEVLVGNAVSRETMELVKRLAAESSTTKFFRVEASGSTYDLQIRPF